MDRNGLVTGMVVSFGRSHGEHTLGEIVRINRKNVKVLQLEPRGSHKSYEVGSLWLVPDDMVTPAKVDQSRVEAGRKVIAERTGPAMVQVVKAKSDSGITPVSQKSAMVTLETTKESPPRPRGFLSGPRDEVGCPVLIDPVTGYHFIGHRGEDLGPFLLRLQDVVTH